jgi:hypothetical protein
MVLLFRLLYVVLMWLLVNFSIFCITNCFISLLLCLGYVTIVILFVICSWLDGCNRNSLGVYHSLLAIFCLCNRLFMYVICQVVMMMLDVYDD